MDLRWAPSRRPQKALDFLNWRYYFVGVKRYKALSERAFVSRDNKPYICIAHHRRTPNFGRPGLRSGSGWGWYLCCGWGQMCGRYRTMRGGTTPIRGCRGAEMNGVIAGVKTRGKWVLLTSHHLSEHILRWGRGPSRWIPLSMVTSIEFRGRHGWLWLLLACMCFGMAAVRIVFLHQARFLDPAALLFLSCFCAVMYFLRSSFQARFVAPDCSIEVRVPLSSGPALGWFCRLVLRQQERLSGGSPQKKLEAPGSEALATRRGFVSSPRRVGPSRRRRALLASNWR